MRILEITQLNWDKKDILSLINKTDFPFNDKKIFENLNSKLRLTINMASIDILQHKIITIIHTVSGAIILKIWQGMGVSNIAIVDMIFAILEQEKEND